MLKPIDKILTPLHIRMAMAAFNLTNRDLAPHIQVAEGTIGNVLKGLPSIKSGTYYAILAFFEKKGCEFFFDDDAPGVRVRKAAPVMAGADEPRKALPA